MALSVEELRLAAELIDRALELPGTERVAWLEAQAAVPAHVRAHLATVLVGGDAPSLPPLAGLGDADSDDDDLQPGAEVGGYRLLRPIGRGGMGSVWLAERVDGLIRRQVALKLPYSLLPRSRLTERFARERNILASLAHPHVGRLYDAGVASDGRPYLALEYIEGMPLLDFCQAHALDLPARLTLILQVLAAVQYAHGRLVVHRDIKPSNILVDGDGNVHLVDFGIAKLLVADDPAADDLTQQAGGLAMTPRYASPEQILGQTVATAADIYSVGVVLFEMVAGALPYRLQRQTRSELEAAILEAEPRMASAIAATPWARGLRGDIDKILAKALRKNPDDRYSTAAAFAEDIRRHLAGEAVSACGDSGWYRLGRFVNRHRVAVAAGLLAVAGLAVGLAVALRQTIVAREEARTAEAVEAFLAGIFEANSARQPDPVLARKTTARELLDIGAERLAGELDEAPKAKARMLRILTDLYANLGLDDRAASFARERIALARRQHGPDSDETVDALLAAYSVTFDPPDGPSQTGPLLDEAAAILDRRGDRGSLRFGKLQMWLAWDTSHHDFPRARSHASRAVAILRDTAEAAAAFKTAADIELKAGDYPAVQRLAAAGLDATRAGVGKEEAPALAQILADAAWATGDRRLAETYCRQALASARSIFGDGDALTAFMGARLAERLFQLDQTAEAERLLGEFTDRLARRPDGEAAATASYAKFAVGRALLAAGRPHEAVAALKVVERFRPYAASPALAEYLRTYAAALKGDGQPAAAAHQLQRAVAMREAAGVSTAAALAEEADIRVGLSSP